MSKNLTIHGTKSLTKKLSRCKDLSPVKQLVKQSGATMQQKAMIYAPVDTGNLKRNIHLRLERNDLTAVVSSDAKYAPYQEYGTRYQAGTPHIRPAYKAVKPVFISHLKDLVK